jgi:hypothetical protein
MEMNSHDFAVETGIPLFSEELNFGQFRHIRRVALFYVGTSCRWKGLLPKALSTETGLGRRHLWAILMSWL